MRHLKVLSPVANTATSPDSLLGECRRYLPMLDRTVSCDNLATRASPAERDADPDPEPAAAKTVKRAPPRNTTQDTAVISDDLRYDQPIPFGPYPVNGLTIEQLIETVPLFAPIEGLEESIWKKSCATCHKWNKSRLCEQGGTYSKAARNVLRHQHPMGGPSRLHS